MCIEVAGLAAHVWSIDSGTHRHTLVFATIPRPPPSSGRIVQAVGVPAVRHQPAHRQQPRLPRHPRHSLRRVGPWCVHCRHFCARKSRSVAACLPACIGVDARSCCLFPSGRAGEGEHKIMEFIRQQRAQPGCVHWQLRMPHQRRSALGTPCCFAQCYLMATTHDDLLNHDATAAHGGAGTTPTRRTSCTAWTPT